MIRKSILRTMICVVVIGCLIALGAQAAFAAAPSQQYAKDTNVTELRPGMTGAQVAQYQERLIYYGYLETASGTFDAETTLATKYFQAANKGKTTGVASTAVRNFINKDTGPVTFAVYEAAQSKVGFKLGAFGLGVSMVQARLKALGYYTGAVNGTYSTAAAKAVVLFKKFHNFTSAVPTVSATDRAHFENEEALAFDEVYGSDTIKPGTRSYEVLEAQAVLRELGYYRGPIDGKYTSAVVTAVKKFQVAHKLYPTGYLLTPTRAKLDQYIERSDGEINAKAYQAIEVAQQQLGKKYRSTAAGPDAFDCSGFTYYVFKKVGVTLANTAAQQSTKGKLITSRANILPGDLVFFATGSSLTKLNHVGMVYDVDDDNIKFVHASSAAGKVIASAFIDAEKGDFYNKRFLWARRMW